MRRKINLFLGDRQVDLDDDSLVLFNYTRSELTDPAIVKNSYSQQITVPATTGNNAVFGHFYRLDRVTQSAAGKVAGPYFTALRGCPFEIHNERDEILESGYAKLDKVTSDKNGILSYSVTLYGGLGGFFYQLSFKDDGTEKTLADMYYLESEDTQLIDPNDYTMRINGAAVKEAWAALKLNRGTGAFWGIFNFAPCYNGLPSCDFSADRAIYREGSLASTRYENLVTKVTGDDGQVYSPMAGTDNSVLLEFADDHTEWEVQDLRSYLQRPVLSLRAFLRSLTLSENTGDYTFKLAQEVDNDDNRWVTYGWMTLPMFDRDNNDPAQFPLSVLLEGMPSPAGCLISLAKMFGLVFAYDNVSKTITLTTRDAYYGGGSAEVTDIGGRIHRDKGMTITPCAAESRYYAWRHDKTFGEFAASYEEDYGRPYGEQRVNTGYEFGSDVKEVLDGVVFKGAADVLESSKFYQIFGGDADEEYGAYISPALKFPFYEEVRFSLYHREADGKDTGLERKPEGWPASPFHYSGVSTDYNDFLPKVQLHGEDNKAEDGAGVLLFYEGFRTFPAERAGDVIIQSVTFHLSDDTDAMTTLNAKPCWDVSLEGDNITEIQEMPSFRRWHMQDGSLQESWDFGDPVEVATGETFVAGRNIYTRWWKGYISDRLDKDTKVVTCHVDFKGMKVGEELLRRFWYFDGCIWVLNKIVNHSMTTDDPTECEFVKVKEQADYDSSQII